MVLQLSDLEALFGSIFFKPAGLKGVMAPKRMKGPLLDVKGLAKEWDEDPVIRNRLRSGQPFLHPDGPVGEDIHTCVLNEDVLFPLLARMAVHSHRPICPVEATQDEITTLLGLNKREPDGVIDVEKNAWQIRKLLGFIKMKCRRSEVSKAGLLNQCNEVQHHQKIRSCLLYRIYWVIATLPESFFSMEKV